MDRLKHSFKRLELPKRTRKANEPNDTGERSEEALSSQVTIAGPSKLTGSTSFEGDRWNVPNQGQSAATFSGDSNLGFQLGFNSGNITINQGPKVSLQNSKPFALIPFIEDPDFVQRGNILEQIIDGHSSPGARVALVGLGGVGKSQLAIQYAHKFKRQNPEKWVFWVHAGSQARFEDDYREIADRLGLTGTNNQKRPLQLVSRWLSDENNGNWLMVIDNADDMEIFFNTDMTEGLQDGIAANRVQLAKFIPQASNGRYLITSRNREVAFGLTGNKRYVIPVDVMSLEQGMELVEKKLGSVDNDDIHPFLQALDFIPLAITQATAYIDQMINGSISRYLQLFHNEKCKEGLLQREWHDTRRQLDARNSILLTWQISFNLIQGKRSSAVNLLSLMSFFNNQGIPESVLRSYAANQEQGETISPTFQHEEDLSMLRAYNLIAADVGGQLFEMHRLVQVCTQLWLKSQKTLEIWRGKFIMIMAKEFPTGEFENWRICQKLYPHVEPILLHGIVSHESSLLVKWSYMLRNAGWYVWRIGKYQLADKWLREAISIQERLFGRQYKRTISSLSVLGSLLMDRGKFEESENIQREVLNFYTTTLGKRHLYTLTMMGNIATSLYLQHKYQDAEQLQRETLELKKELLGTQTSETLSTMHNLAVVLYGQAKYVEAEKLHRETLELRKEVFGIQSPDTLSSMYSLATLLFHQSKYQEAEQLYRETLELQKKLLGEQHPSTLFTTFYLGRVLDCQGDRISAARLMETALIGLTTTLGPDHPTIVTYREIQSEFLRRRES